MPEKQEGDWPEEINIYANGVIEDRSGFKGLGWIDPPEQRYVPATQLEQAEQSVQRLREALEEIGTLGNEHHIVRAREVAWGALNKYDAALKEDQSS